MKKEVFLAITIGFVLGLIITFGIWTANKSLKNLPQTKTVATATPAPTQPSTSGNPNPQPTSTPNTSGLIISQPVDEALVSTDTITLTGKAAASATIVVFAETGEQITTADSTGNFTTSVKLEGGYNQIKVTAFDNNGNMSSQSLLVTYSTSKI